MMNTVLTNSMALLATYTAPITNLTNVITTIMAAAGLPTLAWGIFTFARSYQKRDQNGEHQAIDVMIVGGILLGGSAILSALQ